MLSCSVQASSFSHAESAQVGVGGSPPPQQPCQLEGHRQLQAPVPAYEGQFSPGVQCVARAGKPPC